MELKIAYLASIVVNVETLDSHFLVPSLCLAIFWLYNPGYVIKLCCTQLLYLGSENNKRPNSWVIDNLSCMMLGKLEGLSRYSPILNTAILQPSKREPHITA